MPHNAKVFFTQEHKNTNGMYELENKSIGHKSLSYLTTFYLVRFDWQWTSQTK